LLLHAKPVNAACPGETTGSFLSSASVDNGCRAYRAAAPLHVSYGTTQLGFATGYLSQNHNVRLVTLQLGANDGLLLVNSCVSAIDPVQCVQNGALAVAQSIATNIGAILAALRSTGYAGPIVLFQLLLA
jgi:lysophospholipase L1-like esterase